MSTNKKTKDVGEHDYQLGDVVLAKIRGYPRWPGQVVNPDSVPPAVAKERPGGKKTKIYCVRFFPAGDYSWAVSKDLSLLQKHEIEAYINEPHKKSGDLLAGYKIALDPKDWEEKRANDLAAAEDAEADEEVDQLEEADEVDDDEEDEPKKKAGKKRKRESEPKPKKKKEPKKSSSVGAEAKDKKAAAKKRGGKKNGVRSKDIESEDADADDAEGEDAPAESSKRSGPVSKRTKKDQGGDDDHEQLASSPDAFKVKEWRHRLQRAFLSKSIPKPEEMPEYDQLFTTIESYDLTINQLTYSKLGKVMRHISQLKPSTFPIPNEEKYKIRKRAEALLVKWQEVINQAESGGNTGVNGAEGKDKASVKVEEVKTSDGDKTSEAPVNGQTVTELQPLSEGPVTAAPSAPAEPPAAEGEAAMDTADD